MLPEDLALYPFLNESSEYLSELDISVESLATSRAFENARKRALVRIEDALKGSVLKPTSFSNEADALSELLSYLYARILISILNEQGLIRRFSLQEAVAANDQMLKNKDIIPEISSDLGFTLKNVEVDSVSIHFTDYIRYSLSQKDVSNKMVNKRVELGFVTISYNEFARLIQESIKIKIESSLPVPIPDELKELCQKDIDELEEIYSNYKKDYKDADFGEILPGLFPPCIQKALSDVRSGVNLAHTARFALVSFVLNIGMNEEETINLFNVSPDFDYDKTAYQVEHISKNEYKCPSCSTMITYGNCFGKDEICKNIKHPLGYYSRKIYFENLNKKEEEENEIIKEALKDDEEAASG